MGDGDGTTPKELREIAMYYRLRGEQVLRGRVSIKTLIRFFSACAEKGSMDYIIYPGTLVYGIFLTYENELLDLGYKIVRSVGFDMTLHSVTISWEE